MNFERFSDQIPQNTIAYFAWDALAFKEKGVSFKQLVFLYECLILYPIEIIQSSKNELILQLIEDEQIESIFVILEPYKTLEERLEYDKVSYLEPSKWLEEPSGSEKKSFFSFWKKAEPQLKNQWQTLKSNMAP